MYIITHTMSGSNIEIYNPERNHNRYGAPNQIIKIKNDHGVNICLLRIGSDTFTMIDEKFIEQILELSWHSMTIGYASHTVTKKSEDKYNFDKKTVYLHEFIIKYCAQIDNPNNYETIDHINRCKVDNRIKNLRYANQSMQNFNIHRDRDHSKVHEDLTKIGIFYYPTYISYAEFDKRFVIEKHPQLIKMNKRQLNGTRKGNIIEKYYDVLNKAISLTNEADFNNEPDISILTLEQYNTHYPEYHLANRWVGSECFRLDYKQDYNEVFEIQKRLIENNMNITTKFTNIDDEKSDKNTIIYNADIVYQDDTFTLKKSMIPKYVSFAKETKTRGCKFIYDKREAGARTLKSLSSGSKKLSIKDKYEEMIKALEAI